MRRCTRKPRQIAAVTAVALLMAGCAGSPAGSPPASPGATASRPGPSDAPSAGSLRVTSPFASLAGYLAGRSGRITAALYDRRTGQTWVLHPGVLQDTASIVKVQILGTALREAQVAGRPLPASEQALIPSMIEISDNTAATSLLADVGGPAAVGRFDRLAGLDHTTPSTLALIPGTTLPGWGLTTTTALDQVRLVATFAYPNPVLSAAGRRYGLRLMEHVEADQAWGISGGVPQGTKVALKNGWLPLASAGWQINSIGWVRGHGRNYVLAVLTDHDPSFAYGIATIDTIASRVYAELAWPPASSAP